MLYALATARAPHWSVLVHHVATVVACCATTDTVLLEVAAGGGGGGDDDGGGGELSSAASNGVGFITFFYAGLTAIETALVLAYHLQRGRAPRQVAAMGGAAAVQIAVTTTFFIVLPAVLLWNARDEISAGFSALLAMICVAMYAVELSIAAVRVAIARKKWREHRKATSKHDDGDPNIAVEIATGGAGEDERISTRGSSTRHPAADQEPSLAEAPAAAEA